MSDLFPASAMDSPSPRLVWLRKHNLALGELPDGTRFCAGKDNAIGYGKTHRDAELEYCEVHLVHNGPIEHWSISEFNKAIAPVVKTEVEEVWE